MKERIIFGFTVIVIIVCGLISREIQGVPLFIGDMFYGLMMFYIVSFFRGNAGIRSFVYSLLICYAIEFSQLIQWKILIDIRSTLIGRLILGAGFLYGDLLCYLGGCLIGLLVHLIIKRKNY